MPIPRQRHKEMLFDDEPYVVCQWDRVTQQDQTPPPVQHRLAKL